jgi:putative peptidoglycan lipid II flippase
MAGIRQIASAAGVVGATTLASRVLGFVRDMALAWLFGAGMVADCFFVAFRIPSTLRELFGEGALSAAFIPAFTKTAEREGREAAWRLANAVLGTLLLLLVLVAGAGVLFAPEIVRVLAPGFGLVPGKSALTVTLLRIMFPYLVFVGLAALFMGILNSLGHFLTPALSPTMLNLAMIVAALGVAPMVEQPILPVAVAVLVGGAGQLLIQLPAALGRGWRPAVRVAPLDPGVREIGRLMLPGVAGLAITQINVFVGTLLASFLAEGSVAALTYAFRLVQFPIGVIGVAIGTGALPVLASAFARDDVPEMKRSLLGSLRLAVFFSVPAMVGLGVFGAPIIHVLFERGAFTHDVTRLTAAILMGYAAGLVCYIANRILAPAFYAMQDTRTPVVTGMTAVGVNIGASLLLMGPLGATGLALATAAASLANCAQLVIKLRRRVGPLGLRLLGTSAAKVALACLPMAAWGLFAEHWWSVLRLSSAAGKAGVLLVQLGIAIALFAAAAVAVRCEEATQAWAIVRRRARRLGPA